MNTNTEVTEQDLMTYLTENVKNVFPSTTQS